MQRTYGPTIPSYLRGLAEVYRAASRPREAEMTLLRALELRSENDSLLRPSSGPIWHRFEPRSERRPTDVGGRLRDMAEKGHRDRSRNHELVRRAGRRWDADRHSESRWLQNHAFDGGDRRERQASRRTYRQAPGDHQRGKHRLRGQTVDRPQVGLWQRFARRSRPCPTGSSRGPHNDARIMLREQVFSRFPRSQPTSSKR